MQEFGWSAEYSKSLQDNDPILVAEIFGVLDAQAKIQEKASKKKN